MTVMQNGLMGETGLRRTMPHWPQPGLIPRDPARGDRLETIAYFGSDQYEPQFVKTGAFQDALRQRGVRFVNRFQGEWHDYQHVDAVLAIRDCPSVVLATKPASKLINAWKAGVPALLGPEPAYRELRTSPLDFLEAASAEAVLDSIDRLQQESGLYRRMTEHGAKRAQAFDVNMLTQKWISLLEEARERNRRAPCNAFYSLSLEPPGDQPWKKVVWLAGLKHTAAISALQIRSGEFGESTRNDEEDT